MSTNLFHNATTDRVRAIATLVITLAALLAIPTAGGFASLSSESSAAISDSCSGSAANTVQ